MPTHSPSPRIAVFGHYGNQNLGDEAIIEAVLKNLRHHLPNAELSCFSINPADSASRHGVDSFPIRYRAEYFNSRQAQPSAQENSPASATVYEAATSLEKSWKARLVLSTSGPPTPRGPERRRISPYVKAGGGFSSSRPR